MLAVYLAKLPEHGGARSVAADDASSLPRRDASTLRELVLSPIFGVLSDRLGHHRVMLFGPVFGAVAVVLTGLTTNLPSSAATRLLEGASTAASVPVDPRLHRRSPRPADEVLRGKAAARFEGATLAGLGAGFVVAPAALRRARARPRSSSTPLVYGVLVPDLPLRRRGSPGASERAGRREAADGPAAGSTRPLRRPCCGLARLAARADLDRGQRRDRAVVQPVDLPASRGPTRGSPTRSLHAAASSRSRSRSRPSSIGDRLRRRPHLLGQPVQDAAADDDHPVRDRRRRRARRRRARRQPRRAACPIARCRVAGGLRDRRSGCSSSPARRRPPRAARRHVRALPGRPRRDHGPVLRLPRHRPDRRQPDRRRRGRVRAGIDGLLVATLVAARSSPSCRSPCCAARSTSSTGHPELAPSRASTERTTAATA